MRPSRSLVALALAGSLAGCLAGTLDANSRPGVMPMLSELPEDHAQRDAILDQSGRTAGPENRKGMTKRERKIETTAAFAAAVIGSWFSKTQNVTLGTATTVDENHLFEKPAQRRPEQTSETKPANGAPEPAADELVPWIKLDPKPAPSSP